MIRTEMRAQTFQRLITVDDARFLDRLLRLLETLDVSYCVIGGQGVNAYAEPLVSLDLDLVIAAEDLERVLAGLPVGARVERFPHSVNVSIPESDLRLQFQTDPRYMPFPTRATVKAVLGTPMRVAAVEDLLAGKVWAASDATRRASKRQKDLADIARLVEAFPELRAQVPREIVEKLL